MATQTPSLDEAYRDHYFEALELTTRISETIAKHQNQPNLTWQQVKSMEETATQLRAIADRIDGDTSQE